MDTKLRATVLIIIVLIGAGFAYLLLQAKPVSNSTSAPNQIQEPTSTNEARQQTATGEGAYVTYTEEAVAATKGTKILFFHAAWCPQCRELEKDIQSGTIPEGVTIFKVDYDSSQKLRQRYDVNLQTTLVKIDDSGNEVKKYLAYDDPTLEALIKNLL